MFGVGVPNPLFVLLLPIMFAAAAAFTFRLSARLVRYLGLPGVRDVRFRVLFGAAFVLCLVGLLLPVWQSAVLFAPVVWGLSYFGAITAEARKAFPWLALLASLSITAWSTLGVGALIWLLLA